MSTAERPVIGFLTDFGLDGAAATCRAVMLSICRDAQIVDISHSVRKFAVADGAFLLRAALPYFPVSAHLAVVDPGVGTERRPVALATARGDLLVGPDNGLLLPAADELGGVVAARELTNRELWLPRTSSTFHGRDIFAPVTARLAAGLAALDDVGDEVAPSALVRLPRPEAAATDGAFASTVTYIDSFGNLRLAGEAELLRRALGDLEPGTPVTIEIDGLSGSLNATFARSFGGVETGATLLYIDSSGGPAIAANQGDLAARTGVGVGAHVAIWRG